MGFLGFGKSAEFADDEMHQKREPEAFRSYSPTTHLHSFCS